MSNLSAEALPRTLGLGASLPVAVALALTAAPTIAQESDPTGFYLSGRLNGSAIQYEDDDATESGGGVSVAIGYGFNRSLTAYIEAAAASVEMATLDDTYTLAHFDLGVRWNLGGAQRSTLGFLTAAISGRAASLDVDGSPLTISGTGATVGGGVTFFLKPSTAIDVGVRWTGGSFSEVEYDGQSESIDVGATSARFDVGVTWWRGR